MSPQDIRRHVWDQLRQKDLRAFADLLPTELVVQAAHQAVVPLGRGPLHLINLVWLALASALHTLESFKTVLDHTLKLVEDGPHYQGSTLDRARQAMPPVPPTRRRHDPRPQDPGSISEEAFAQARQLLPWGFWVALILLLTQRFEARFPAHVRFGRYRLLTLDGTCLSLAGWKPLRNFFGTTSNGKGQRAPQARLVMLQLPLVRLPWRYELTPITEGERTVAARLLDQVQRDDLVLMDRGFFSYGLFWQVVHREAHFAIRAIQGVKFTTVQTLADGTRLVDWTPSDRRWRKQGLPATIRLRVIDYQIKGFRPSAIVTSVLEADPLDRAAWIGMALVDATGRVLRGAGLYHRRWEIETTYAELKEIQGLERSLRGRTPETIVFEVAGHVLLYLLVRWRMVEAAEAVGEDPLRLSYSGVLSEVRAMLPALVLASPRRAFGVLVPRLLERMAGHFVPLRPGRHYPRPHDTQVKNKGKGKKQLPSKLEPVEVTA
jgi:Transposase DDE domain